MRILPKKSISEEQLSSFNSMGESIGNKVRRNRYYHRAYLWLSAYGRKHTKAVTAALFVVLSSLLLWGILRTTPTTTDAYFSPPSSSSPYNYDDSIRSTQEKIEVLLQEANGIRDSVASLIERGSISRAESLYVIRQTKYLHDISQIIKK